VTSKTDVPSAVCIVPMLGPGYKRPPWPRHPQPTGLVYNNGPLITSVQVYSLFWGAAWQGAQSGLVNQLNQFFQFIVTSPLIDQLSEYSVPAYPIAHGAFVGANTVIAPAPPPTVTDADIQNFVLQNKLPISAAESAHPQIDNHVYFVFTPPGVAVTLGGAASCGPPPNGFCGYHSSIPNNPNYAVVPYPACTGCSPLSTTFDSMTMFCSHELCEAITDPIVGRGWYGQVQGQQGEIGDFCNQQPKSLGGYTVQKMWSNANHGCV
jgi:hypothetical protein